MSTQSIIVNNLEHQQEYFEKRFLRLGKDFMMHKRFMIGEKPDMDEMLHVQAFYRLLCTDNCELIDFIYKKIKGKLKDCDFKGKRKPTISDLFKMYQQYIENSSVTEILNDCCDWEEVAW